MDLNKKLEELKPYQLNCNVFDVYSYNGLTMQDLLCQFFTKINECVKLSNQTIDLSKWLVNEGLEIEVVKKLMSWLEDGTLENVINVNVFNSLNDKINKIDLNMSVSVKDYGAKGDGENDDTDSIVKCFNHCFENGKTMYFPNGLYILNETIKPSVCIVSDPKRNKKVMIKGESFGGVVINSNVDNSMLIDVGECNNVYMENITTENGRFNFYPRKENGASVKDFMSLSRYRNLNVKNCISLSKSASGTHFYNFIVSPKPDNYDRHFTESMYSTYPYEIHNNTGYNAININNVNMNDDKTIANPSDNSAIGITDISNGVAGVIFIDMYGERKFLKFSRRDCDITSGTNSDGIVYEISPNGHVAIGCSYLNNDPNAPGVGVIKARASSPSIQLYDFEYDNLLTRIMSVASEFRIYHNGTALFGGDKDGYIKYLGSGIDVNISLNNLSKTKGIDISKSKNKEYKLYLDSSDRLIKGKFVNGVITDGSSKNNVLLENLNGATSQRPTGLTWGYVGLMYFDQTLNKPIWWAGDKWVDAVGSTV